jgi:hypothetical protein
MSILEKITLTHLFIWILWEFLWSSAAPATPMWGQIITVVGRLGALALVITWVWSAP